MTTIFITQLIVSFIVGGSFIALLTFPTIGFRIWNPHSIHRQSDYFISVIKNKALVN